MTWFLGKMCRTKVLLLQILFSNYPFQVQYVLSGVRGIGEYFKQKASEAECLSENLHFFLEEDPSFVLECVRGCVVLSLQRGFVPCWSSCFG